MTAKKIHPHLVILIGWLLFILLVNALWLKIDHRPPRWDESTSLLLSEYSFQNLKQFKIIKALTIHDVSATKPGMGAFLSAVSYFIVGHSTKLAVFLINSLSFLSVFIALYVLGSILFDRTAGLFSAILFSVYPGLLTWSRYYNFDIQLTAVVSLTVMICVLICRTNYRHRGYIVFLGCLLAIGSGIKHLYLIFASFPVAFLLVLFLKDNEYRIGKIWRKHRFFVVVTGVSIIAGLAYHAINYKAFVELFGRIFMPKSSAIAWWKPPSNKDYFFNSLAYNIGAEYRWTLAFFLAGFGCALCTMNKYRAFVFLWFISAAQLFLYYSKMTYYFYPVLPAIALFTFAWMPYSPHLPQARKAVGFLKIAVAICICFFPVKGYLEKSLGTANPVTIISKAPAIMLSKERLTANPFVQTSYWDVTSVDGNRETLPFSHYWPIDEMLDSMLPFMNKGKTPYRLAVMTNYEWMSQDLFKYKIWQRGLNNVVEYPGNQLTPPAGATAGSFLMAYDFVITKSGSILKKDFYSYDWAKEAQAFSEAVLASDGRIMKESGFEKVREFPLPDKTTAVVWQNANANLISYVPFAQYENAGPGMVAITRFAVNKEERVVMLEHPGADSARPTAVHFPPLKVKSGSVLRFGIAINGEAWKYAEGKGVTFIIEAQDGGKNEVLFRKSINPQGNPADRKWFDHEIPLDKYSGRAVRLTFKTAAVNGNLYAHAGWSEPVIMARK